MTFEDDLLSALEPIKGNIYSSFPGTAIYRVRDFEGNKSNVMIKVDVLWQGEPNAVGRWYDASTFDIETCYNDKSATPEEIKLFEGAEKRAKENIEGLLTNS